MRFLGVVWSLDWDLDPNLERKFIDNCAFESYRLFLFVNVRKFLFPSHKYSWLARFSGGLITYQSVRLRLDQWLDYIELLDLDKFVILPWDNLFLEMPIIQIVTDCLNLLLCQYTTASLYQLKVHLPIGVEKVLGFDDFLDNLGIKFLPLLNVFWLLDGFEQ